MTTDAPANPRRALLERLYQPIVSDLEQVEAILARELATADPQLGPLLQHARQLGGKRLRPALLLLVAKVCGAVTPAHHVMAAVVEMIHTATLLHDDVLDEAVLRRHLTTVNVRWGHSVAILLGDYLFSHAFYLASSTGNAGACARIGRATNTVCAGELRQHWARGMLDLEEPQYLEIVSAKTGALCACSCELGALLADKPEIEVTRWAEFGRVLGIAFQITDDLLDLLGNESVAGKSLGRDAAQRVVSLPWIYLWQKLSPDRRRDLAARFDSNDGFYTSAASGGSKQAHGRPLASTMDYWLSCLEETGALQRSWQRAAKYADLARQTLRLYEHSPSVAALHGIIDFVLDRPC